jgi:hypothetical protein
MKNIPMNNENYLANYNRYGKFIFLEFTKELIRNYCPEEILKIKNIMQEKQILDAELEKKKEKTFRAIPEKVYPIIEEKIIPPIIRKEQIFVEQEKNPKIVLKKEEIPITKKEWFPKINEEEKSSILKKEKEFPNMQIYRKPIESKPERNSFRELKLVIPETKFPMHIQYIKPVPINKEIDLGKLNPLINDRFVKIIECYGPNENLFVKGAMGAKRTGITLTDEEIKTTINKFSEETKIPAHEGVFKVASGRLLFSAIISETVGSKFIISKIPAQEQTEAYKSQHPR